MVKWAMESNVQFVSIAAWEVTAGRTNVRVEEGVAAEDIGCDTLLVIVEYKSRSSVNSTVKGRQWPNRLLVASVMESPLKP